MKKRLLKLFNSKTERKQELIERSKTSEDVTELRSINKEIDILNDEIAELRSMIDSLPDENNDGNEAGVDPTDLNQRNSNQTFNPIATFTNVNSSRSQQDEEDIYSTLEYRQAFKNYVIGGTPIPEEYRQHEQRSENEITLVGDVAAVIPTTIMNKVIEDLTVEGKIISRITQTSIQGGVEIPVADINPTATWLASESEVSKEQKAKLDAKVKFGYHILEAKVAIGLLTSTVTLPVFENTVVRQLKKAMIRAIESAVISGTGSGQPKGLTTYNLPTNQIVKMNVNTIGTIKKWSEVEATINENAEDDNLIYIMNKATWEKYLNGMTDTTGQKIGLGKINEKGQKILNGREVLTVDKFPSFDAAEAEDTFGCVVNLSQYMLNSNLSMYYKKYFNEDTNKW
ncbi:MAG: phage major capsid protein, partial [Cetobacterium sp.]|nr:phage major capsid protein [Cetobacterium sp.]